MDTENYWIPRTLDAPALFFLWEADCAMVFICGFVVGGVMGMFFLAVLFSWGLARAYSRLKEIGGKGLLVKLFYWWTPSKWWLSRQLPSHVREYIGG